MYSRSSFETKVLAAFVAAACVVSALITAAWKLAQDATDAASLVAHTHQVLGNVAYIRADTLQIELSTQSFRVSGDPAHITERDLRIAAREKTLAQLQQLTLDNPPQQARWSQLRAVIDQRLAISRQVEMLRKTQGMEAANAFVASAPLRETRALVNHLLQALEQEENRLLSARDKEQSATRAVMVYMGLLVAGLLFALLAATYVLIRRQLQDTRASQRALADNERNLATTLNSIGDAVLATDLQGRVRRMNPVAEQLTGWDLEAAVGKPVTEVFHIVHEYTRAPAPDPVAQVLATNEVQQLANHTVLLARDGRECPIADSAAPIRNGEGQMTGVVLVFRNETVARRAQRAIHDYNTLLEQRVQERTLQLHESEGHLQSVISNVPAMIAYVDAQQRYVYVNQQYRERFAPEHADITGCTVREILGEARYAIAAPLIAKVLAGENQTYDWQPFPGVWQVIQYIAKRNAPGEVSGYYVLGNDITARKRAEEDIQSLNTTLAQHVRQLEHATRALKTLSAGNRAMLRATTEQDLLNHMCEAIVNAGGYGMAVVWYRLDDPQQSLLAMAENGYPDGIAALRQLKATWADKLHGQGVVGAAIRSGQTQVVADMATDASYAPWRAQVRGAASALACPIWVDGIVIGAMAIYDVEADTFGTDEVALLGESADDLAFGIATLRARAEQQRTQDAMYQLTRYDALTGLPNETQFTELLSTTIASSTRSGQSFAVLQANIERLSEINDALGFSHGDHMLQQFGERISAAAPAHASVARLRGDEFAILLPGSDTASALAVVQRLNDLLARPFPVADIALQVSARIGVSLFPAHGNTPHDLYRHMDIAVHQAKKTGMPHVVFDPHQSQDQTQRLNLAGELQRAIAAGDLMLYLQPKVEMQTGRVCGAEALVRWKHAERGIIPPGEFIGLAEHTGLIKPLTEWVIQSGVRLLKQWEEQQSAMPIAMNLSARNLRDETLLEQIRNWRAAAGLRTGLLELEITESAVMEDAELALRVLQGLQADGIPLYIDDFGTGYSSLSYLQKLPVSYIKIDQSFVRQMQTNKDSALIVRSTIDLVHDLGRHTVAEGVETQEQWDLLLAMGCDIAQGYFIARPMPAEMFQDWVRSYQAQR